MPEGEMSGSLPVGKLPADLLARLLARAPLLDERVILGPGIGLDCAVIDFGDKLLVLKSDPITFATDQIGWYAVQVNANDIATSGAQPRWMLATLLLPERGASPDLVERIGQQIFQACREIGVSLIGGHTEITAGLERPILVGAMIGEVQREQLVTPRGARPGDRLCLTKGIPIEATALLAREFPDRLEEFLSAQALRQAQNFLFDPGISVVRDAQIALRAGRVTAMHDPTEGGLATALWELAEASQSRLIVDAPAIPILPLAGQVCRAFGIDPLAAIASGALLFTAAGEDLPAILAAFAADEILCRPIGHVEGGAPGVWRTAGDGMEVFARPERDAIARLFD
jgi:hydrogenase maturation factor